MAKKGGNKKKSNARKNQKKVITTPSATPSTPEESSPITPVNALDNDQAEVLTGSIEQEDVTKEQQQIEEKTDKEEDKDQAKQAETPSILSNALDSTSENIIESLDVKEALEEPPQVEVKAEPVAVILETLSETEPPVVITLEKSIIPEEQQQTIDVEPVPENISPVLPKVETEELPLLQEKAQDQEPVVLVVSESESTNEPEVVPEKEHVAVQEPSTVAIEATIEEQIQQEQEPKQEIARENDIVPEQNEPKSVVPQATETQAQNVQEPHVSEPVTSVNVDETSQLAHTKELKQEEPTTTTTEASNEPVEAATTTNNNTEAEQQVASVAPVVIVDEAVAVPAETEKETIPPVSATLLEKEDTPSIRSQSVLTSTNTDATINEEEIITPKSSLKKSRSLIGSNNNKDKSVTKRKSQILSLFKRGGDKTPPPVPELPVIQTEKKPSTEKKLSKRKSWMFWKSSTAVAGQQKN